MANIEKGVILNIEGPKDVNGSNTKARVQPQDKAGLVSRPLVIPWWLRGSMGNIAKGTEVAYVLFEDQTGVILSRMDGEWSGTLPGTIAVLGNIKAKDVQTESVPSLDAHVHGGVESGPSKTSRPE